MPLVDDKVLTDWNGMMIAAMARAGALLGEPRYVAAAEKAAGFVLRHLDPADGPLRHAWRNGEAKLPAFVDDYAFFLRGLLALYEVGGEKRWLAEAVRLAGELEERLLAPRGGYYMAAPQPGLLVQPLTVSDGAIPSGNAVLVHVFLGLARATGEARYRARAERSLKAFARELERFPGAVPMLAAARLRLGDGPAAQPATAAVATGAPKAGEEAAAEAAGLEDLARQVVTAAATVSGDGPWRPLAVRLRMAAGWHVNANPASEEFLIPTRVEGRVRDLRYPAGKPFRFAFASGPIHVYAGEVTIPGEAAGDAEEVLLTYQACDDRRCLPPVTTTLPLGRPGQPDL
jgi:hypothetical protein